MPKNQYFLYLFLIFGIVVISSCSTSRLASSEIYTPPKEQADPSFIHGISMKSCPQVISHRLNALHFEDSSTHQTTRESGWKQNIQEKYAQILDVSRREISNFSLYHFIDQWWGVPYLYGGDSRNGIDCSAFVQKLFSHVFHLTIPARTASEQYSSCEKIKRISNLKEGDLVFFKTISRRRIRHHHYRYYKFISHVGIYLANNKFVDASSSAGVTINDLDDAYWKDHYAGAGRMIAAEN
ncbi:MAG: C40 family peptidase [Chitinophagaceae bacterium]